MNSPEQYLIFMKEILLLSTKDNFFLFLFFTGIFQALYCDDIISPLRSTMFRKYQKRIEKEKNCSS